LLSLSCFAQFTDLLNANLLELGSQEWNKHSTNWMLNIQLQRSRCVIWLYRTLERLESWNIDFTEQIVAHVLSIDSSSLDSD